MTNVWIQHLAPDCLYVVIVELHEACIEDRNISYNVSIECVCVYLSFCGLPYCCTERSDMSEMLEMRCQYYILV